VAGRAWRRSSRQPERSPARTNLIAVRINDIDEIADSELKVVAEGEGRPALVLHGGGGPATVAKISQHLAASGRFGALTPTHPGWNGAPRPDSIASIPDLARLYLGWLDDRGLRDVLVLGSSIGGWIAAEMAAHDQDGRLSGLVLLDAVGIEVDGEELTDFFSLDPRQVVSHTFYDSERYYVDPASLRPDQVERQAANMASLRALGGDPYMHDPDLPGLVAAVRIPVLLIYGEADRISAPAYGRAFADLFPNGRFELVAEAGHLPQVEQPAATLALIDEFAGI
jgi:pimeloyl-ACP methyl ester carboxylesterase